jgi:hypothetical protein
MVDVALHVHLTEVGLTARYGCINDIAGDEGSIRALRTCDMSMIRGLNDDSTNGKVRSTASLIYP